MIPKQHSTMSIVRYSPDKEEEWNTFLKHAKNATFLFDRGFMDYHQDRFQDHSLMVYNEKNNLVACFPANEAPDGTIWSHQGLTYGSFIFKENLKLPIIIGVFQSILNYYAKKNLKWIRYKAFPRFYNDAQTDEIEYCLFLCGAKLYRRDTALAVDRLHAIQYSGNIRREAKRAEKIGVIIEEDQDFKNFWNYILAPNLEGRFQKKPVHSVNEIELLKNRFPDNIKLFTAKNSDGEVLAGTVFFLMKNAAHCQYISAGNKGRSSGALNYLFVTLLRNYFQDKRFFDFGIANENEGKEINYGLLGWKERMGGRTYSHDFYEIETTNHIKLEKFTKS